jgi:hypothetical protein
MNTIRISTFIVILALALSACAPAVTSTPELPAPEPAATATLPPAPIGSDLTPAALAARQMLAGQLGVAAEDIKVLAVEPVEWPDGCLGLAAPDQMCTQAIVPGYRLVLEAQGQSYIFRTNEDGSNLVRENNTAEAPVEENLPLLVWQNAECSLISVEVGKLSYGSCGGGLTSMPWDTRFLEEYGANYAPFEAETPAGKITFNGKGANIATEPEQRAIAEWAKLQHEAIQSNQAAEIRGLALDFERQGGIAGFSDKLTIYLDGTAVGGDSKTFGTTVRLTVSEMQQVYTWFDTFAPVEYSYTDPATADAMTITLSMPGQGTQKASDEEVRVMTEFAANLLARARFAENNPDGLLEAQKMLADFLAALQSGDYTLAAKQYAGDTSVLAGWNPDIKDDLPKWLERACTQNGLKCLLPRTVIYRGPDVRDGYQFLVEFNNPDNTLFQQGPCCGETSGSTSSTFIFSVVTSPDGWKVMDLPPYVP